MLTRIIGTVVVVIVLYAIITQPQTSANTTRNGVSKLGDAGHQVTTFLTSLVSGASASNGVRYTPTGGVAAGDGSSVR